MAALDQTLHGEGRPALKQRKRGSLRACFRGTRAGSLSVSLRQGDLKLYGGWREASGSGKAFCDFCDADSPTIA